MELSMSFCSNKLASGEVNLHKHPFTQVSVGKVSAVDSNVDKSLEDDHSLTLDKEAVWNQCHKTFFFVIFWLSGDKHSSLFDLFVNHRKRFISLTSAVK
jgi:hypothetical protein